MRSMRLAHAVEAVLVAILVAGCSGDGGGGGNKGGDPPVADAGDNDSARIYQTYTLDGSGSLDPEDKPLSFTWSVLSAPAGPVVTITDADTAEPTATFTPDREGVYVFGLVVSDGKKLSALDTVEVSVQLRVAVFGDPYSEQPLASMIEADGSDPDGWSATPDTDVVAADETVFAMYDTRDVQPTLLAFDSATSNTFLLAFGDIDPSQVLVDSPYVIWNETRNGQPDLFAHDVTTGQEFRLTNSVQPEFLTDAEGGVAVWYEERDPVLYGFDVFAFQLANGTELIVAQTAEDETVAYTNGNNVLYALDNASTGLDVWRYDIDTETTLSVNTMGGPQIVRGIGGNKMLFQNGGPTEQIHIQDVGGGSSVLAGSTFDFIATEGDHAIFYDSATLDLFSLRLSTAVTTSFAPDNVSLVSVRDSRALWYNEDTGSLQVTQLPAGSPVSVTATTGARSAAITANGLGWSSLNAAGVFDSTFSSDNGASTTLMHEAKTYLDTQLANYDVVLLAGNLDSDFARSIVDAADAAGVPMLSATTDFGAGDIFEDSGLYAIDANDVADCGPNRVVTSVHEVFSNFALGIALVLDDVTEEVPFDEDAAKYFETDGAGTLPADYQIVANYDLAPCAASGAAAIVTFTTPTGTRVLLDGAANGAYEYAFWSDSRIRLLREELLWLASTNAP